MNDPDPVAPDHSGKPIGREGVEHLFRLVLGRSASPETTIETMSRLDLGDALRRLLGSTEFGDKVLAGLRERSELPQERGLADPATRSAALRWLAGAHSVTKDLTGRMAGAADEHERLRALVDDPVLRETFLDRRLVERLDSPAGASAPSDGAPGSRDHAMPTPAPPPTSMAADAVRDADLREVAKALARRLERGTLADIRSVLTILQDDVIRPRVRQNMKDGAWSELIELGALQSMSQPGMYDPQIASARAMIYEGDFAPAARTLTAVRAAAPKAANAWFYAGAAHVRAKEYAEALPLLERAAALRPKAYQYAMELATCRRRVALLPANATQRVPMLEQALQEFGRCAGLQEDAASKIALERARTLFQLKRFAKAEEAVAQVDAEGPHGVDALVLRSRILLATNCPEEALKCAEAALEIRPDHEAARKQSRALKALVDGTRSDRIDTIAVLHADPREAGSFDLQLRGRAPTDAAPVCVAPGTTVRELMAATRADWIVLATGSDSERRADAFASVTEPWFASFSTSVRTWAGKLIAPAPDGSACIFYRSELLVRLADSGVLNVVATLTGDLAAIDRRIAAFDALSTPRSEDLTASDSAGERTGTVAIMSRYGVVKFGGAEHFMHSVARYYEALGHDTVTLGTKPERIGEEGVEDGRRYAFVEAKAAAIRRYVLDNDVRLVHALPGLGHETADALEFLDVPFVYGVHYWRDCFGSFEGDAEYFRDVDRNPIPRPDFRAVLQRAANVYANSRYTQALIEEAFAVRTPIIYPMPDEVDTSDDASARREAEAAQMLGDLRDYVVLVNARPDKGFDLLLRVAARCADIPFLVIASQSDKADADAAVAALAQANVTIIDFTPRMDLVYQRAKIVAVPSYRFVETFSLVCIESQRFGKPVFGSDKGNVPYLLKEAGTVLPEDADVWATELRRVYDDPDHYDALAQAARLNAAGFPHAAQGEALVRTEASATGPILIAVGSGLGNMLRVGPMIRNISRRLGRRVDVVVAQDHAHSLFLLHDERYVNTVYDLTQTAVLRRRYRLAFVTHSFGRADLPVQAERIVHSNDWMPFEPGGALREAVFNLGAAKALLGIDYDASDVTHDFVGTFWKTGAAPTLGVPPRRRG